MLTSVTLPSDRSKGLQWFGQQYRDGLALRGRYEVACFGPKSHYRKDGTCRHTDALLAALKSDWHRRRTRVVPFGSAKAIGG